MERITKKEAKAYFPPHLTSDGTLRKTGYYPVFLSIFDHWLTLDEFQSSQILLYRQAVAAGKQEEYMSGEYRFLALYRAMAKDGAFVHHGDYYWRTEANDPMFQTIMEDSLRGTNADTLMDVYFIGPGIRAVGGWDRTDILLLPSEGDLPAVKKLADANHLHLLDAV